MSNSRFPDKGPVLRPFTCIGYFKHSPHQPMSCEVDAVDVKAAILAADIKMQSEVPQDIDSIEPFINTFVLRGHCEILSTWAD